MNNTCNACGHRQADEYSFCEECGFDTLSATAETPTEVGAAASGEAVAWLYEDGSGFSTVELNTPPSWAINPKPLYLHPATVTNEVSPPLKVSDEDVTQIIRLAHRHEGHDPQLRAALSSFANKENRND